MDYKELKYLILSDLYRYSGRTDRSTFLNHFLVTPGFKYTFFMRFCLYLKQKKLGFMLYPFFKLMLNHYMYKYGISIPYRTRIGSGFYIGHFGCIVVNESVTIGRNCNISHGVTIGVANRGGRAGSPSIGDNVYIAPGAKIIGRVSVGSDAAIGANCVVTRDVPESGVAVGIPGRVISRSGSSGYINRTDYDSRLVNLLEKSR